MKNYCDTMLIAMLPTSHHPDAAEGAIIELTKNDLEYISTQDFDGQSIDYENLCLEVRYITDSVILGSLIFEVDVEIKMGFIDPSDYHVVGER